MKKEKNKSVFKKIWSSITDFEKYQEFADEKVSEVLIYFMLIITIISFVVSVAYTVNIGFRISDISKFIDNNINEINFIGAKLTVNNNEAIIKEDNDDYVFINTEQLNEEKIKEFEAVLSEKNSGTVLLQDRLIVKNEDTAGTMTFMYKDLVAENESINVNKQDIQNIINGHEIIIFYIILIAVTFVLMLILYSLTLAVYALMLAVACKISCILIRLPLKYKSLLSIAVHALTLPTILQIIYFIINLFTGFTIKYFQIMYVAIAYIYVIAAVLMIKADYIKSQLELSEIEREQAEIRDEYKENETQSDEDKND